MTHFLQALEFAALLQRVTVEQYSSELLKPSTWGVQQPLFASLHSVFAVSTEAAYRSRWQRFMCSIDHAGNVSCAV